MTKEDLSDLKKYFRDIYPHIYEHYKFLYGVRTNNKKFEFLLAFESLLILIFITLFGRLILSGEEVFLVPLFFFLGSLFFSLYILIPRHIWFPWFEKEDIEKVFENGNKKDFYEESLRTIYGVLDHLWNYNQRKNKIFFINIFFLYLSVVLVIIGVLTYYEFSFYLILLFSLLFVSFWIVVILEWGRELVPESPAPKVEKFFDDWKEKELRK